MSQVVTNERLREIGNPYSHGIVEGICLNWPT
jgi:hypothetical protein